MPGSKHWVFTVNNYTPDEYAAIVALSPGFADYLVVGKETGESGTPHLQGYICFKNRKALATAKRLISPRAHLETKQGTPSQASEYCKKDGDFVEFGTLPGPQGKRSDWDDLRAFVEDLERVPSERELASRFPGLFARYRSSIRVICDAFLPRPVLMDDNVELRPWQSALDAALVPGCTDRRSILFYVDSAGNAGKSFFCRYWLQNHPDRCQVLGVGKVNDVSHIIDSEKDVFLVDCERSSAEFLQYRVLEQLKNQMVFSTKYSGQMKTLRKLPHVVVFMNEQPNMESLSEDRYIITEL